MVSGKTCFHKTRETLQSPLVELPSQWPRSTTKEYLSKRPVALLAFNQEDLSVVAQQLSQKMDCKIVLDEEVAAMKHLYVDYRLRRSATLGEVLDEINNYIRREHKIILRWKQKGDTLIIYKFG